MSRKNLSPIILTIVAVILGYGCKSNPTLPGAEQVSDMQIIAGISGGGHQCLGLYTIAIDTVDATVDIVPVRSSAFHVNVVSILNTTMGVTAAPVPGESDPSIGLFTFDITLEHPFATSPQLAGFDVKGILITPGTLALGALRFADADETRLGNADGFTRWWNPGEFTSPGLLGYTQGILANQPPSALTANVNPYKLFADILDATTSLDAVTNEPLTNPGGRAVFTAGSENTRSYRILFPMNPTPVIKYGYAVDASWMPPSPNPPEEVPDSFPIEANQPEAYRIVVSPTVNTLYFDDESGVGGGVLRLRIDIYDWQGQAAGDISPQVNGVSIFSPGLMSSGTSATFLSKGPYKSTYFADLTGKAFPKQAGPVSLIFSILSAGTTNYKQGTQAAPDSPVSAYQVKILDVTDPDCIGDANNDWSEAVDIGLGDGVANQVCLPDDYRDYYRFTVEPGFDLSGEIKLFCDATPTTVGVYDIDLQLIEEASVAGYSASIPVDNLPLYPGEYYIRIFTSNDVQTAPYYLELAVRETDVTPYGPVEVTPESLFCDPDEIWHYYNNAIMFGSRGLWIYNVSDIENPVLVSSDAFWGSWTSTFYYPWIYFIHHDNTTDYLSAIDLSDIDNPILHEDIINFGVQIADIVMNSGNLYVALEENTDNDLLIYDWVSSPELPSLIDTGNIDPSEGIDLMNPEGNPTVLVAWAATMVSTYDVESPASVDYKGTCFIDDIRGLDVLSSRIYAVATDAGPPTYTMFAMSDTTFGPNVMGNVALDGMPYSINVQDDYAYIGNSGSFTVVDVSDPSSPSVESSCDAYGYHQSMLAFGTELYTVINDGGFNIYDISYPPIPQPIYHSMVVNDPQYGVLDGDYLYVADSNWNTHNVLKSVDVSDPSQARVVDEIAMTNALMGIVLGDGFVAVMDGLSHLVLVDISDPANLSIMCSIDVASLIGSAVWNDTLYISTGGAKIIIYDVTYPAGPVYITTKTYTDNLVDLAFSGDTMFATTSAENVDSYSITNPYNPTLLDTYATGGKLYEICVVGGYLYLCNEDLLEVVDIGDPASMAYAGSLAFPGSYYRNMATDQHFAYMCGDKYGGAIPTIVSGWPPSSPSTIYTDSAWPYGSTYDVQVGQGFMYVSSTYGMRIYDLY